MCPQLATLLVLAAAARRVGAARGTERVGAAERDASAPAASSRANASVPEMLASVPEMLCAGSAPAPRVAACLAGTARTFERPLVHRSVAENVLRALGAEVKLFACWRRAELGETNAALDRARAPVSTDCPPRPVPTE